MDESDELRRAPPAPPALGAAQAAFEDAHHLWHAAADAYHDPEPFRRHTEACIQALRNVTWRLQAAKTDLPGDFDAWYGQWRAVMGSDERMRWLVEARNDVVKRGGLRAESLAVVRVIDSYLEPDVQLLRLPATMPSATLVQRAQARIPARQREHVAIEVRRRWLVADRADDELLGLLSHCLHILDALLIYVRELHIDLSVETPEAFIDTVMSPPCMRFDLSEIPLLFEADSGEPIVFSWERMESDPAKQERAARRYGDPIAAALALRGAEPRERAEELHSIARNVFKRDGFHVGIVHLRRPDGTWEMFLLEPRDKRDKFLTWHSLAGHVRRGGHDAIVVTTEVWTAPEGYVPEPYANLEHERGRGEALVTWLDTADGTAVTITSPIVRMLRKPYLKKATRQEMRMEDSFLRPIHRAWNAQSRPDAEPRRESAIDQRGEG